ncbi:hypothetical protein LWI29_008796 [Acer saccharum]|uniref:Uncharacterized protein n=1 Tax=Acer saccharum TaxID=4024 RepID=A0AA39TPJ7_ACESA|nr:hypothetical protein LWI29_008796 [Acer saccharum]
MRFESRLERFATNTSFELSNTSANALVKSQRGGSNNNQGGGQFRGRGRSRARGRGGRYNNGSRPICQVCGKLGRIANVCYHRFDQTYSGDNTRQSSSIQGNIAHQTKNNHDIPYQVRNNSHNAMVASSSSVANPSWLSDEFDIVLPYYPEYMYSSTASRWHKSIVILRHGHNSWQLSVQQPCHCCWNLESVNQQQNDDGYSNHTTENYWG